VVEQLGNTPTVVLGVCTPEELTGWPDAQWILLDCGDDERRRRMAERPDFEIDEAIDDATNYRALPLRHVDTTGRSPRQVAHLLADLMQGP